MENTKEKQLNTQRKMKDSGIAWIGEIPEDWEVRKMSTLFNVIGSGTTPSSSNDEYYGGQYPWLQSGDLNDGQIINTKKRITDKAVNDYPSLTKYIKGDLVIAMYGATIGKLGKLNIDCYTNQACCVMSNPSMVNVDYVYYWLFANRKSIIDMAFGGGQPNINQQIVKSLKVSIPNKKMQDKIVDKLESKSRKIDQIISVETSLIEELKSYKQSLITEVVTGQTIIHKDTNGNWQKSIPQSTKSSGINWIGEIPSDWIVYRMKNIGRSIGGLTYSPNDIVDNSGTLVMRSSNIKNGKLTYEDNVFVNLNKYPQVLKGDIFICSRNGSKTLIGKNAYIEEDMDCTFGAFMMIYRPNSFNFSKYIYYIFNSEVFQYYLGTFLTATINQLTKGNLDGMEVVCSQNVEEQRLIAEYLDEKCSQIDKLIQIKENKIKELNEYKKSIIYEYVTGKKEVV